METITTSIAKEPTTPHVRAPRLPRSPSQTARTLWRACLLTCATSLFALPAFADPVTVSFSASQLTGSEWRYTYQLAGSLSANDDLAIYFPFASSSSLSVSSAAASDFSSFVLQPDPSLPADGEVDLVAGISGASFTSPLTVDFLFSGSGSPSSQSFALFDASFNQIASGTTTPAVSVEPVPEPGSFALLGSGALTLWHLRRRHRA